MNHHPDIRNIYSHTKRIGCKNNVYLSVAEFLYYISTLL